MHDADNQQLGSARAPPCAAAGSADTDRPVTGEQQPSHRTHYNGNHRPTCLRKNSAVLTECHWKGVWGLGVKLLHGEAGGEGGGVEGGGGWAGVD